MITEKVIEPTIPPIRDPLGRCWDQPDLSEVLIDDTHALMDQKTFDGLLEYSTSLPTGTYAGKAWKSEGWQWAEGKHGPYRRATGMWLLHWYFDIDKPNRIGVATREIIML